MAKSKEQKRREALERLEARLAEQQQRAPKSKPTFGQQVELNALRYPKRQKTEGERFSEKLFGPSDPVTGIIWADPLPWDFQPTPQLVMIVGILRGSTDRFVELGVDLSTPEGFRYPTYQGSGNYLDQWVARHTDYTVHHSKNLYGDTIMVVFSRKDEIPQYDENDYLISGTTVEMYNRR